VTFELNVDSAASWVNAHGLNPKGVALSTSELAGGVSASVVAVTGEGIALVVKQALPRLRVADVWEASTKRSLAEFAALELLGELTPGAVPRVLIQDPGDHAFALELLPASARNWQTEIAEQRVHPEFGLWAGRTLGSWHAQTAGRSGLSSFESFETFEELRLVPFHEAVMQRRPELAEAIAPYLAELRSVRRCLVSGDYAPKNIVVEPGGRCWVLDLEVAHIGNPVFDLGFFLSFVVLSAVRWPTLTGDLRELAAVAAVNGEIASALVGGDASDQLAIDTILRELDGTPTLERLGAKAVLAASVASAVAAADAARQPLWRALDPVGVPLLPLPMVNVVSGGAHARAVIDIQDVLVVPVGASSFSEAIEWAARVRSATAEVLRSHGHRVDLVADEGGLAAPLPTNRAAVEAVAAGIQASGLAPGEDAAIAIDVAATQFFDGQRYRLSSEGKTLTADELVAELRAWCDVVPIVSIEDPLAEDDFEGWQVASRDLGDCQLVGDDLFVTSPTRLANGIAAGIANAVLVKPNQIGTLSDALTVVKDARAAGYATVLSARSGETEDAWLADLAVGWRTEQIKVGSTTTSERTTKWNRLLRLEAEHPEARFAGRQALTRRGR
jgi:enolase